jgi:hypothetical protein
MLQRKVSVVIDQLSAQFSLQLSGNCMPLWPVCKSLHRCDGAQVTSFANRKPALHSFSSNLAGGAYVI